MTGAEVVALPVVSLATAVIVATPSERVAVSQSSTYGYDVSSGPALVPLTLNWTLATATLSTAVAVSGTVPEISPASGAVIATTGGITSAAAKVTFKDGRRLTVACSMLANSRKRSRFFVTS